MRGDARKVVRTLAIVADQHFGLDISRERGHYGILGMADAALSHRVAHAGNVALTQHQRRKLLVVELLLGMKNGRCPHLRHVQDRPPQRGEQKLSAEVRVQLLFPAGVQLTLGNPQRSENRGVFHLDQHFDVVIGTESRMKRPPKRHLR